MGTLFSVAEARAFDKVQLASVGDYPDATISAKEVEIRDWLEHVCGVNFTSTSHEDTLDGDGGNYIILRWPKVTAVASITIDGVALTADEISPTDYDEGIGIDADNGIITRRAGSFTAGWSNVVVQYTAGHTSVPKLVKRAALQICVNEVPATNVPWQAENYDAGGASYSFTRGDGFAGNWSALPDVMRAIRMYTMKNPGVT